MFSVTLDEKCRPSAIERKAIASRIAFIKFTCTGKNQNKPDFKPRGVGDFSLETGSKARSASIPTKNYKEKLKYML